MKAYYIEYKTDSASDVHSVSFLANNKAEAYDKAVYEVIPAIEGAVPYSAWVASVTYNNGKYHRFDTFEGLPY